MLVLDRMCLNSTSLRVGRPKMPLVHELTLAAIPSARSRFWQTEAYHGRKRKLGISVRSFYRQILLSSNGYRLTYHLLVYSAPRLPIQCLAKSRTDGAHPLNLFLPAIIHCFNHLFIHSFFLVSCTYLPSDDVQTRI